MLSLEPVLFLSGEGKGKGERGKEEGGMHEASQVTTSGRRRKLGDGVVNMSNDSCER